MDAGASSSSTFSERSDSTSVDDSDEQEFALPKRPKLAERTPRRERSGSGRFKKSWNAPFIVASSKGEKFDYVLVISLSLMVDIMMLNVTESSGHQRKYSESQSNSTITSFWGNPACLIALR